MVFSNEPEGLANAEAFADIQAIEELVTREV